MNPYFIFVCDLAIDFFFAGERFGIQFMMLRADGIAASAIADNTAFYQKEEKTS